MQLLYISTSLRGKLINYGLVVGEEFLKEL